tara:strand:+ start:521 stop:769 length:249 start_codon:yes stop_codon:yes gene_type:complete
MKAGTVTISLADYHAMVEAEEKADNFNDRTKRAAKELSVFLTFLATRSDVESYISEFNRQSSSSKIVLEDGRATINFLDGSS